MVWRSPRSADLRAERHQKKGRATAPFSWVMQWKCGLGEQVFFGGKEDFIACAPEWFVSEEMFSGISLERFDAREIYFVMAHLCIDIEAIRFVITQKSLGFEVVFLVVSPENRATTPRRFVAEEIFSVMALCDSASREAMWGAMPAAGVRGQALRGNRVVWISAAHAGVETSGFCAAWVRQSTLRG